MVRQGGIQTIALVKYLYITIFTTDTSRRPIVIVKDHVMQTKFQGTKNVKSTKFIEERPMVYEYCGDV